MNVNEVTAVILVETNMLLMQLTAVNAVETFTSFREKFEWTLVEHPKPIVTLKNNRH